MLLVFLAFGCKKSQVDDSPATKITYQESLDIFFNPERGFVHSWEVHSEGQGLSPSMLQVLKNTYVSMIQRTYYIEDFTDKPLSEKEISLIQSDMQKLRDAGIKAVLRFAYTDDINGTDAPLAIVMEHLDQLKPVFEENKDVIAFVQAGFIGAWGEWHSSSNGLASPENEKIVLDKFV